MLPPPAVLTSTSPSRSRHSSSSIVVESPSCRPSPSSCRRGRTIPHRCTLPHLLFAIAPSIAAHRRCALGPSPPRSRRPLPSRSHRTVSCRPGAVAPSIAIEEQSRRTSPLRSRLPCRLTTPATRHAPPRPLVRMVVALPLLTPPPSIC